MYIYIYAFVGMHDMWLTLQTNYHKTQRETNSVRHFGARHRQLRSHRPSSFFSSFWASKSWEVRQWVIVCSTSWLWFKLSFQKQTLVSRDHVPAMGWWPVANFTTNVTNVSMDTHCFLWKFHKQLYSVRGKITNMGMSTKDAVKWCVEKNHQPMLPRPIHLRPASQNTQVRHRNLQSVCVEECWANKQSGCASETLNLHRSGSTQSNLCIFWPTHTYMIVYACLRF